MRGGRNTGDTFTVFRAFRLGLLGFVTKKAEKQSKEKQTNKKGGLFPKATVSLPSSSPCMHDAFV